jgi:stage V sporulation protein D (sporulation-specific penicillin-binding protein)
LIIVKLFYIQVLHPYSTGTDYLKTRKIPAERGKIYDRNDQPLVVNQTTYLLYAEPKKTTEKDKLVRKVAELTKMDEASIEAKINTDSYWASLKSGIGKDIKDKLLKLNIPGIAFEEEYRRYYPESSLAAQLLGFVGKNKDGDNVGYFGVEGFYDKDLAGLPGLLKSDRDLSDKPIFFGTQDRIEPENGRDFILTVDRAVQQIIKNRLQAGLERYQAKEGCVIVADPMTLEILGMSCLPDFDPDKYYLSSEDFFKNSTITDLYEPGSIFKPLVMAAGIESKAIKPDEIYNEEGPVTIGDYSIKTWDSKYEGKISMTRILEKSSNVGMVYIGEKLGNKRLYQYINDYGFGQSTGIDLQGEVTSYLRPENQWYPIDYATATFGQGIAITPMQMVRAFAVLINGGKLLVPHVVLRIDAEGREQSIQTKVTRTVLSERTSSIIKKMLQSTVDNGEVKWAKPKGYAIGGKTGTAQIPIAGHYDPSKTIASFIGFAPVDHPKFMALVILREPKASQWGSETAAPIFFEIAKDLIVYYNIAPGE